MAQQKELKDIMTDLPTASTISAGDQLLLKSGNTMKTLDGSLVAKSADVGNFYKEGSLSYSNFEIFKNYYNAGEVISIIYDCDKRVNVVAKVNGSSVILKTNVQKGSFDYTVVEELESIGFYIYGSETTNYKLNVVGGINKKTIETEIELKDVKRELGRFESEGSLSYSNFEIFKNYYNAGEVISIIYDCDKRVNVVAKVNGSSVILKTNVQKGSFDYTVIDGFESIGFYIYGNETTNYKLNIVGNVSRDLYGYEQKFIELKTEISKPSTRNLLKGFGNQELFNDSYCVELKKYLEGKNSSLSVKNENGVEFSRISIPSGTTIDGGYKQVLLYEYVTSFDENGNAECYVSMMCRNSETLDIFGIKILTNSNWSSPNITIKNTSENFALVSTHVTKSGVPGAVVKFQLKFFLSGSSSYTTESDVTFDFYNVSMSSVSVNRYNSLTNYEESKVKVLMTLGDSITTDGYYNPILRKKLGVEKNYNLAVVSATLCDKTNTNGYDGNPITENSSKNVLGNQIAKILSNTETYTANPPDVILIAIGTNDETPSEIENDYDDVEGYFTSNDGTAVVDCTAPTFDDYDTYKSSRLHFGGALRYAVTKLEDLFPKAKIFVSTPIQSSIKTKNVKGIRIKQQLLTKIAERLCVEVIHTGEECGISQDFEYGGCYWKDSYATASLPKNGRDLRDGLHPNSNGSEKMAEYLALQILSRV